MLGPAKLVVYLYSRYTMIVVGSRVPSRLSAWQPQQYWRKCSLLSLGFAIPAAMVVEAVRDRGQSYPTCV